MKYRALIAFVFASSTALAPVCDIAFAQSNTPTNHHFTQAQLRKILASFALYSDDLLANIMLASTYPDDLVAANAWAKANNDLALRGGDALAAALSAFEWNASVKALVTLPPFLESLADDLSRPKVLADIVSTQPVEMMDAIQQLRFRANANGLIASNDDLTVSSANGFITILADDRTRPYFPSYKGAEIFGPSPESDGPPFFAPPPKTPPVQYRALPSSSPYWSHTFWIWSTHQIIADNAVWDAGNPQPAPATVSLPPPAITSAPATYDYGYAYMPEYEGTYRDDFHRFDRHDNGRRDERREERRDRNPPPAQSPAAQPPAVATRPPVPATPHVNTDSTPSLQYGLHGGGVKPSPTPTPASSFTPQPSSPPPRASEKKPLVEYKSPPLLSERPASVPPPPPQSATVHTNPPPPKVVNNEPPPALKALQRLEDHVEAAKAPAREESKPASEPPHINPDSSPALKCGLRGCGTPK